MTRQNDCLTAKTGVKCVWRRQGSKCVAMHKVPRQEIVGEEAQDGNYTRCLDESPPRGMTSHKELCKLQTDCVSCVQTSYGCVWCGKSCSHEICRDNANAPATRALSRMDQCEGNFGAECMHLHTCNACMANERCVWSWPNGPNRCKPITKTRDVSSFFFVYFEL